MKSLKLVQNVVNADQGPQSSRVSRISGYNDSATQAIVKASNIANNTYNNSSNQNYK